MNPDYRRPATGNRPRRNPGLNRPGSLPTTGCRLPATNRTAFSLVEILVIVAIVLLLAGILLPAFDLIRAEIRARLSQTHINLIAAACDMYADDFDGDYPPSTSSSNAYFTVNNDRVGKKLIVLLLTGYANNPGTKGTPGATMSDDDGKDGFGFRLVAKGKVYGPYNGTEKIPTVEDSDSPVFADAFGNPVLYYRLSEGGSFIKDHNPETIPYITENDPDSTSHPGLYDGRNMPFLLITPGKNGDWDKDNDDNDDLVNP
ncbi:MAG: type II secretion system protein [Phycisphaerae bacterium]|nr:type II secretion system protein [Phycisphaerae bacterium]